MKAPMAAVKGLTRPAYEGGCAGVKNSMGQSSAFKAIQAY